MFERIQDAIFEARHGAEVRRRIGVVRPRPLLLRANHWGLVVYRFIFVATVLAALGGRATG